MTYRVSADIRYLDGVLGGLTIPDGYTVTVPDERSAAKRWEWVEMVRADGDFVRAAVTGNRYEFVSRARMDRLAEVAE